MLLRCLRFNVQVNLFQEVHQVESSPTEQSIHFISCHVDFIGVKQATSEDTTINMLKDTIFNGWPPFRKQCPQELWEFWNFRCDLVLHSQKRHRPAASCGFYRLAARCEQVAAGVLTSSTCSKPVEIRLAAS